jgi:RNA polymerase sigma-70 factor, ECF subfamily
VFVAATAMHGPRGVRRCGAQAGTCAPDSEASGDRVPNNAPETADAPDPAPVISNQERERFVRRLYVEHGAFLVAFVLRLTGGDRHLAEDVTQETLLRAWRHADQLISGGAPSMLPWLTTVARRIVINHRRSRRARPPEVEAVVLDSVPAPDDTERMLQRGILLDALRRIGPAHRRVVVEMYFHGHTAEEASRRLGIPVGTVKSRSFYAMRALRAVLRERGVEL